MKLTKTLVKEIIERNELTLSYGKVANIYIADEKDYAEVILINNFGTCFEMGIVSTLNFYCTIQMLSSVSIHDKHIYGIDKETLVMNEM